MVTYSALCLPVVGINGGNLQRLLALWALGSHTLPPTVRGEQDHHPVLPALPWPETRACDDRGVSAGHGDPLRLPGSHWLWSCCIPAPSLQPPPEVLRIHIPAYQELSVSSVRGSGYAEMWRKKSLCESFSSRLDLRIHRWCFILLVYLLISSPSLVTESV